MEVDDIIQVKLFAGYRYQIVEDEFNAWSLKEKPFLVKSILEVTAVPKSEGGNSIYFTMAIFYKDSHESERKTGVVE